MRTAAILLPFAAIGSLTAASLLRMSQGETAGVMPSLLTGIGFTLIVVLVACIVQLHKMHVAKRTADATVSED